MNYPLKNSNRNNGVSRQSVFIIIFLVLSFSVYIFAPEKTTEYVISLGRPAWNIQHFFSDKANTLVAWLSNKDRLLRENTKLRGEIDASQATLQTLDAYRKENESLKKLLGRTTRDKRILASIIAKPNQSSYDTLILDVGRDDGIVLGNKVVFDDFIIGTITEVLPHQAKASLFSSQDETFQVVVGDSKIQVEAFGRGGGNFLIKLPKDVPIKNGDMIKAPGLSLNFFGTVQAIEKTVTSPFQLISFTLPININEIDWVEIINS